MKTLHHLLESQLFVTNENSYKKVQNSKFPKTRESKSVKNRLVGKRAPVLVEIK